MRRAAIVYDCLYPSTTGGGERVYRRIAELLVGHGFEVDYVTRRQWSGDAPPPAEFRIVSVWDGDIAADDGVRSSVAAIRFAAAVRSWLRQRRHDYDLVVASALPTLTLLAARSALGRDARALLVGDWLEVWPAVKWRAYAGPIAGTAAALAQRIAASAADINTVNSRFTARRLERQRPRGPVEVLGLLDLIDDTPGTIAAADPPVALFLGRHIADKRAHLIPGAVAEARARIPNLRAVIAGDGPERARIAAAVTADGLDGIVTMPGFLSEAERDEQLSTAAVLVNPSAREGFGLVVAEAAARGVPSVLIDGDDNAAVELLTPGVNGAVAADPSGLADALVSVVGAGAPLRQRTRAWYESERRLHRLADSVERLVGAVDARAAAGRRTRIG